MSELKQIVSLSGGKDSTAMLLMMLERGERVDEVVTCDTGMEFPEMYEHIDKLERDTGISFVRLKPEKSFEYLMYDQVRTRGKFKGVPGYGWARPHARWCTAYLKTNLIGKYYRDNPNAVQCVGIAADESWRAKDKRYPLIEWGVTEADALAYCYQRGYTWGGLYEHFRRVSCWCCPLQPLKELRELRRFRPELWSKLREMDKRSWNTFRIDYSVEDLERRFADEEKQMEMVFDE